MTTSNEIPLLILFLLSIAATATLTYFITKKLNAGKNTIVLPLKLQAHERLILFLERISLSNLLIRENGADLNVLAYQQQLLSTIRQEYNHNLSQQIYVSQVAWAAITRAMTQTAGSINQAAAGLDLNEPAIELSKRSLETLISANANPTDVALQILRDDVEKLIG